MAESETPQGTRRGRGLTEGVASQGAWPSSRTWVCKVLEKAFFNTPPVAWMEKWRPGEGW